MLIIPDPFDSGAPALIVMLGAVLILIFLRLAVPRLIEHLQAKKHLSDEDVTKKSTD